jgi:hypothetical protein
VSQDTTVPMVLLPWRLVQLVTIDQPVEVFKRVIAQSARLVRSAREALLQLTVPKAFFAQLRTNRKHHLHYHVPWGHMEKGPNS